jgi:hypothetical protein
MLTGLAATLLATNLFVEYLRATTWWATRDIQHPGVQNEVIFERYIFDGLAKKIVLVGSSVSTQLPPEGQRPENVATLFAQGSGGMTGLEAIVLSQAAPRVVLIEANFLNRGINEAMLSNIFNPYTLYLRKNLRALRYEFNPLNLLYKRYLSLPAHTDDSPKMPPSEWDIQLAPKIDHYKAGFGNVNPSVLKQNEAIIDTLKRQVKTLSNRGSRIIFYFTPMHHDLIDLPVIAQWSNLILQEFGNDYEIILPKPGQYTYLVDGIHFFVQSGKEYFDYLMRQLERLEKTPPLGRRVIER